MKSIEFVNMLMNDAHNDMVNDMNEISDQIAEYHEDDRENSWERMCDAKNEEFLLYGGNF